MNKIEDFFAKNKPIFLLGAVSFDQFPKDNIPEIAFLGKSNVGKSSLINAITRSSIAITSKTPGRTKQLNFFNIANKVTFVDMPGYGFAKANKEDIINWNRLIFDYLSNRCNLKRLFLLIDSRRGLKENDFDVIYLLDQCSIPYQIILTKTDEVNKIELEEVYNDVKNEALKHAAMLDDVLTCSSKKSFGLDEIRKTIYNLI